jgi:hypothetical protein
MKPLIGHSIAIPHVSLHQLDLIDINAYLTLNLYLLMAYPLLS